MIREKITLNPGTKYPLRGLLTLPDDLSRPVPAVVLVHGSGSSNMDEKVGKMTPFKDLAEGLAARGIAAVRYDKRSYAHPLRLMGEMGSSMSVKEETVEDAVAAAELLRSDSRIDPARVYIIGHSMGAMLAPRIDAEGGDFAGLILLAGTPQKLEEVLKRQIGEQLAAMPKLARKLSEKKMTRLLESFEGLYNLTDQQAKQKKLGGGVTLYYFKEMGEHPAEMYLKELHKPILIAQGTMDCQVSVTEDFGSYRQMLEGRERVTFRLYEGLNHCFVPARSEKISEVKKEYSFERHIGPEVLDDLARWIHENP